jgi:beta-galactosidase
MLAVYLDGTFIGFNKDSRTPAEYDLSTRVRAGGTYELLCVNPRYSDASWVEDQDHWWQAGIHRDVYLYATPTTYLHDIAVQSDFNDDFSQATVRVTAWVRSQSGPPHGTLRMHLLAPDGRVIGDLPIESAVPGPTQGFSFEKGHIDTARVTVATTVEHPLLWNPETPHLYTVVVTLEAANHTTSTAVRTGLRHVEISNRELRVNSVPSWCTGSTTTNTTTNWAKRCHGAPWSSTFAP